MIKSKFFKTVCVTILCLSICLGCFAFSEDTFVLSDVLNVDTAGNKLTVSAALGSASLPKGGSLTVIILNKDCTFDNYALADIKQLDVISDLEDKNEISYSYALTENDAIGRYAVKLIYRYAMSKTYTAEYILHSISEAELLEAIEDLKTVTSTDAVEKLDTYVSNGIIAVSQVPEYESVSDNFGESFVLARELMAAGSITGTSLGISQPSDVTEIIRAAVVFDALFYGTSQQFEAEYSKYSDVLAKVFTDKTKANQFYAVVSGTEAPQGSEAIWSYLEKCAIFAIFQNGTYQDVIDVIEIYGDKLGIDMDYLSRNNVSASEIAPKIDRTNAAQYFNSFPAAVKEEADEIIASKKVQRPSNVAGGGSSGGGGGGGGMSYKSSAVQTTPVITPAPEKADVFTDLNGYDWAKEAIERLYDKKIINGKAEKVFAPEDYVTRAEFLKMLVCALDITQDGGYNMPEFNDCAVTDWWYPYVGAAYSKGIANGMGESFGASMTITREDAVTFLGRAAEAKGIKLNEGSETKFNENISAYALNYILAMYDAKIVVGDENGCFNPKGTTTRAQAAVMIDRFLNFIEG